MNRNELQTAHFLVVPGDGAAWGSNVPANYTRYIYRVKVQSLIAAQTFTLGRRENLVAGPTNVLDTFFLPLLADFFTDPDEIEQDAEPIYKIQGPVVLNGVATVVGGVSNLRAFVDVGTAYLTVWYIDAQD